MPPLTPTLQALTRRSLPSTPSTITTPFLHPILITHHHQQTRHASILGSLSDNPSAYNKRIKRGRGPASGKGKTSGRGHKGQKQHGKVPAGFIGGQTPLEIVKGTRGFENQFSVDMTPINLDRIQSWIDQGRLDTSRPITLKELQESRCTHGIKDGVKLLARNTTTPLAHPIHITVSRASGAAIAAIESAGGSVQTRYYTRPAIRRILRNESHPTLSLMSPPTPSLSSTTSATNDPAGAMEAPKTVVQDIAAPAQPSSPSSAPPPPSTTTLPQIFTSTTPPPTSYRYRLPDATSRKDLEYYRDPAHRGYLSYQVAAGSGPSLFFKTPGQIRDARQVVAKKRSTGNVGAARRGEERLF